MLEITGDLWTIPADWRGITTNGDVKTNGACVMGRGCALEAKTRYIGLDRILGRLIQEHGNHVFILGAGLISFPVKHHWRNPADINLIRQSAHELADITDAGKIGGLILLPHPGCGNGGLNWSDVRPVLNTILDDRFTVTTFESKGA